MHFNPLKNPLKFVTSDITSDMDTFDNYQEKHLFCAINFG